MNIFHSALSAFGCLLVTASFGATISGTVTEAGSAQPVAGATVGFAEATRQFGRPLDTAVTDDQGNYSLTFTIDPDAQVSQAGFEQAVANGEIVLEVVAPEHAPQRLGDALDTVDCFWFCELANRVLSTVGSFPMVDEDSVVHDFALTPGAVISGHVAAANGGDLPAVPLSFYTSDPFERISALQATTTDNGGNYRSAAAVKPGIYFAGAGASAYFDGALPYGNFVSQAFGGFDCEFLSCAVQSSNPIDVPGVDPVTGVNFALNPGGELRGQLVYAESGLPLSNPDYAFMRVWTPDDGRVIATTLVYSDRFGPQFDSSYLLQGLSGSYIVEIDPSPSTSTNLIRILSDGTRCPFAGCDRGIGIPLNIVPGSPQIIDFALERGGRIAGNVTDAQTGAPYLGAFQVGVSVVDANDKVVGGAVIDETGAVLSADGITPGQYFVKTGKPFTAKTFSGQGDTQAGLYRDQLLLGVDCQGLSCDLTDPGAMPITIVAGEVVTGVDFALRLGHTISGTVTGSDSGNPLAARNVEIFTTGGQRVALEVTGPDGTFMSGALPDGAYRLVVKDGGRVVLGAFGADGLGYFGQVFGNPDQCMQDLCNPTGGSDITIAGSDVTGIDVALNPGPTISGQVIDTDRGLPILLTVDVFDEATNQVGAWTTLNSGDASYTTGALIPGNYTLVPRTTRAYSVGSSAVTAKGNRTPAGTLLVAVADNDITDANLGVFRNLLFAADFESR